MNDSRFKRWWKDEGTKLIEYAEKSDMEFICSIAWENGKFCGSEWSRINTLGELISASINRKSVIVPDSSCWNEPRPAAFVANLQGRIIDSMIKQGMYIYKKEQK